MAISQLINWKEDIFTNDGETMFSLRLLREEDHVWDSKILDKKSPDLFLKEKEGPHTKTHTKTHIKTQTMMILINRRQRWVIRSAKEDSATFPRRVIRVLYLLLGSKGTECVFRRDYVSTLNCTWFHESSFTSSSRGLVNVFDYVVAFPGLISPFDLNVFSNEERI